MRPLLLTPLLLGLVLAATSASCAPTGGVRTLTPIEAADRVRTGEAILIDVREAAEWRSTGVVATAHLLALSDLRGARVHWAPFLEAHKDRELILYCRSGNRSGQAARLLAAEGLRAANAGALDAWIDAGQPTRRADDPPAAAESEAAP